MVKRGFRPLSSVSGSAAALLPPEEAARAMLLARVPSAREGVLDIRLRGGELLLATGDKNVRHQVESVTEDLMVWFRGNCPEVRRIRWTMG